MSKQATLFSGIKPTGTPHIGNYLGALKQWVELQSKYRSIYSIVDYHAITIDIKPTELKQNIYQTARILLSIGINPKRSIIFLQSQINEHTELAWIFNCLVPVAEMQRMTQYKDKAKQHKRNVNLGLLAYPALMAADILLYHAQFVPVGEDQLQHLELTRLIARKFNHRYGDFFPEPEPIVGEAKKVMSLSYPDKKMSKDLGSSSYISLLDSPEIIRKKVRKAVTDTGPETTDKMSTGVENLFNLLLYFDNQTAYQKFKKQYQQKKIKYAELKEEVATTIIKTLKPIQKRAAQLTDAEIKKILTTGQKKAQIIAKHNIKEIKKLIGTTL